MADRGEAGVFQPHRFFNQFFDRAALHAAPVLDLGQGFRDFGDTAGLIENLDLVISVDTSVAHLAGALGKPVWVLVPFSPDWRWMLERRDSPWYPSATLFRQPAWGDWEAVIGEVSQRLRALAGGAPRS